MPKFPGFPVGEFEYQLKAGCFRPGSFAERISHMRDKTIVLSISMLISGQEDMPKSLESLRPFKEELPCEIILVDTGCGSEQRKLAEKYADKIVDFAWCDDFAAARNAGLKEALGEWFLYLDDDEWFEDPQEIIAFFKSGEYRDYNCASYVVRNYSNFQGTLYADSYPSRMVKLEPETRFQGKIHEYIEPFKLPKKTFSDFVHHYGYVYRDQEERRKHACRNIEPLIKMRKEHPGDPRWMCQLAQEYFSISEYEKVIEVCREGLEEWQLLKAYVEYAPAHIGAIYAYILVAMESMKAYGEEEKWFERAVAEPLMKLDFMKPTMAFFCLAGARMYDNLGEFELCREYLKRYLEYHRKYKDDRSAVEAGTAAVTGGVFQEGSLYGTILICMEAVIRMEDHELSEEAFYMLDWSDRRLLRQEQWEEAMLEACCSVDYHPLWVKLMQTLVSREEGMKEMLVLFLKTEIAYKEQGEKEKLSRLYRIVAELDYEHPYILCTKILWAGREEAAGAQSLEDLFRQLFEKYTDELPEIRSEVWAVADSQGIPIEPLLLQVDMGRWGELMEQWCRNASAADLQQWDIRIRGWRTGADVHYDVFTVKCLEGYLCQYQEICPEPAQLEALLRKYSDSVLALWEAVKKNAAGEAGKDFTGTVCGRIVSQPELQLAGQLRELQQHREQGDDRRTLESVKKCLGIYPVLDPAILAYAGMLRDEAQARNSEAEAAQEELKRLVSALKAAAKQQLEAGEYQAAKDILLQVEQCVPGDEEVRELLTRIRER